VWYMQQLLVTANVVPSSLIIFTLMEAIRSPETSVLTRVSRCHIPQDGIPHGHHHESLTSYRALGFYEVPVGRTEVNIRH
jgi:hypothetical protein